MRRTPFVLAIASVIFVCHAAYAQGTGQDVATAQALFDEGKRLMAANKFAEACPKLVESQRLDPGGGTLLAIALCHEGEGKTATAWADYGVAAAEARRDGRKDREQAANDKVRALEPKLTKMRVVVAERVPGMELKRDGNLVGEAQWGLALPIDPGSHVFSATAPGRSAWSASVDIRGEGKTVDVPIPHLREAEDTPYDKPLPPSPVETTPVVQTQKPPPPKEPAEPSMQKTWAVVAGGTGVVAIAVGLGFGAAASSKWSDAQTKCPNDRCTVPSDTTLGSDAGRSADIATVLVTAGAGAVVAGVILWLTAPKTPDDTALRFAPTVARDSLGLSLGGRL